MPSLVSPQSVQEGNQATAWPVFLYDRQLTSCVQAKRVKLERLNGNRRTPESDERELDFRAGAGDEDEDGSDDDMEDDEEEDEDEQEVDPEDSEDEDAQLREYAARRAVELAKGNLGVSRSRQDCIWPY